MKPRIRELGVSLGRLPTGPHNGITDVPGVRVGQVTLHADSTTGPVRTGVTVILPHEGDLFRSKVAGAVHVINAYGKAAGLSQVQELGTIETPIALTNTLSVGAVMEGLLDHILETDGGSPPITSVNVLVGECNDGALNDIRGRHIEPRHVLAAIESATTGPVAEGAVGAGTGMSLYGWKGGIGTASRVVLLDDLACTVGVLVLANFGRPEDLVVGGMSMAPHLVPDQMDSTDRGNGGSCIVVVATDAPLGSRQLLRIARRGQSGIARTGTYTSGTSGEYVVAFSTTHRVEQEPQRTLVDATLVAEVDRYMNPLFQATVESTEEAIVNALFVAETMVGLDGTVRFGFPGEAAARLLTAMRT